MLTSLNPPNLQAVTITISILQMGKLGHNHEGLTFLSSQARQWTAILYIQPNR